MLPIFIPIPSSGKDAVEWALAFIALFALITGGVLIYLFVANFWAYILAYLILVGFGRSIKLEGSTTADERGWAIWAGFSLLAPWLMYLGASDLHSDLGKWIESHLLGCWISAMLLCWFSLLILRANRANANQDTIGRMLLRPLLAASIFMAFPTYLWVEHVNRIWQPCQQQAQAMASNPKARITTKDVNMCRYKALMRTGDEWAAYMLDVEKPSFEEIEKLKAERR